MSLKIRSLEEWLSLITECRQSGLSDADWCREHGIATSSFYNACSRLRKRSCEIPASSYSSGSRSLDLTASVRQDVVRIDVVPELSGPSAPAMQVPQKEHLDNSHMIEIQIGSLRLAVSDPSDLDLLEQMIGLIRRKYYAG